MIVTQHSTREKPINRPTDLSAISSPQFPLIVTSSGSRELWSPSFRMDLNSGNSVTIGGQTWFASHVYQHACEHVCNHQ